MKKRGVLLVVLSAVFLAWNISLSSTRRILIGTFSIVNKEDIVLKVGCPGKVEPKVQETVRSEVDGKKMATLVQVGDFVKKGQKLMEISGSQIKIELTQKRTAVRNAKTDMLKAKRDWQLEKTLYKEQAVPKRDVEAAQQTYERSLQNYNILQQELELLEKRAKGVNVLASMDGMVIKNFVENEDYISSGKELFKLAQMGEFIVRGNIDELDIAQVKVGQEAVIRCDAFPDVLLDGQVHHIAAQAAEGAFAEIEVIIEVTNKKNVALKPNLSAEVSIIVGRLSQALVIPSRAVRNDEKGPFVIVSRTGGWLKKQPVKVTKVSLDQAIIADGLEAGQSILVPKDE